MIIVEQDDLENRTTTLLSFFPFSSPLRLCASAPLREKQPKIRAAGADEVFSLQLLIVH